MNLLKKIRRIKTRWWVFAAAVIAIAAYLIFSPAEKPKQKFNINFDPETTPTMWTDSVETWVTDSGYVRYKIEAELWEVFDEAKRPNWKFRQGLYLEQYDDTMGIAATFICDSAMFLSNEKLWEFSGNVRLRNTLGDRFLTEKMFWNTNLHKIYSDSFIHIEKTDRIIEGYGFDSNENITDYTVRNPKMILPMSDFNHRKANMTAEKDSVQ